jgi:(5-formylfuran-3-yl)methyl phosphate synthase
MFGAVKARGSLGFCFACEVQSQELNLPGLLVSVRSAAEASAAVECGASIIDIKEPANGPLGMADVSVWTAVRRVVPRAIPVSVALGEVADLDLEKLSGHDWSGISYRKIGLAGSGSDWAARWEQGRDRLPGPSWVAVAYADWRQADAPEPGEVIEVALRVPDCVGLLVDTWDKSRREPLDVSWASTLPRVQAAGKLVVLAGGLDSAAITSHASLRPDLFAVRGAACVGGDRHAAIDPDRVASLARLVASLEPGL